MVMLAARVRTMKILAFDTCFGACSAALSWDGGIASRVELLQKGHAERLMPMIAELFEEAPIDIGEVDLIAVTNGPGTFTGVRIGIAAARALKLATGAATCTASSLRLMSRQARATLSKQESTHTDIAVAVDARRDELYFQLFGGSGEPLTDALLVAPSEAVSRLRERDVTVVGSGGPRLAAAARAAGRDAACELSELEPDALHLLGLAADLVPSLPQPLYLRPPDAKPQTGTSLAWAP